MSRSRWLAAFAFVSGALCLSTGLSYLAVRPTQLTISALVTVGVIGCCALVAAGLWQARAGERRRLPVAMLGLAGLGFVVASIMGFAGSRFAHTNRLEPTGLQSALHGAGVVVGAMLCVWAVVDILQLRRNETASLS